MIYTYLYMIVINLITRRWSTVDMTYFGPISGTIKHNLSFLSNTNSPVDWSVGFLLLLQKLNINIQKLHVTFCYEVETWNVWNVWRKNQPEEIMIYVEWSFISNTLQNLWNIWFAIFSKISDCEKYFQMRSLFSLSNVDAKFSKDRKFRKQNKTFQSIKLDTRVGNSGLNKFLTKIIISI